MKRKHYKLLLPKAPDMEGLKPGEMVIPVFPTEDELNHWAERGYVVEFATVSRGSYLMAKEVESGEEGMAEKGK